MYSIQKINLLGKALALMLSYPGKLLKHIDFTHFRILFKALKSESFTTIVQNIILRVFYDEDHQIPERIYKFPNLALSCEAITFYPFKVRISGWAQAKTGIRNIEVYQNKRKIGEVTYGIPRPQIRVIYDPDTNKYFGFFFVGRIQSAQPVRLVIHTKANTQYEILLNQMDQRNFYYDRKTKVEKYFKGLLVHSGFQYLNTRRLHFKIIWLNKPDDAAETKKAFLYRRKPYYSNWSVGMNVHLGNDQSNTYYIFLPYNSKLIPGALSTLYLHIENHQLKNHLIYWDEDQFDNNENRHTPHYKPAFSKDYFYAWNYIGDHICVSQATIDMFFDNQQLSDSMSIYRFLLQLIQHNVPFYNINQILSTRPEKEKWPAECNKLTLNILNQHFRNKNKNVHISKNLLHDCWDIHYPVENEPAVGIIIPFKDRIDLLERCLNSLSNKTRYANYKILLLDNDSQEPATQNYINQVLNKHAHISVISYLEEFNYSAINNFAVKQLNTEYILLLNSDVEFITEGWLEKMLGQAQVDQVGAVGACLLYADDSVQHAGVIVGLGGVAEHAFKFFHKDQEGYFRRLCTPQDYLACTAACLLMKRELYLNSGGLDEENLPIAFNDVDLCLKIHSAGYRIVYTPHVRLYHLESASRGSQFNLEKYMDSQKEISYFKGKWSDWLQKGDPYYPKEFSYKDGSFSIR